MTGLSTSPCTAVLPSRRRRGRATRLGGRVAWVHTLPVTRVAPGGILALVVGPTSATPSAGYAVRNATVPLSVWSAHSQSVEWSQAHLQVLRSSRQRYPLAGNRGLPPIHDHQPLRPRTCLVQGHPPLWNPSGHS
jgi:hypothetical protein